VEAISENSRRLCESLKLRKIWREDNSLPNSPVFRGGMGIVTRTQQPTSLILTDSGPNVKDFQLSEIFRELDRRERGLK